MIVSQVMLKPIQESDAEQLFPLVYKTSVVDTICWEGPSSLEEFKNGLKEREEQAKKGEIHLFSIIERGSGEVIGSIDLRPYEDNFIGDMGLWIGVPYHGKGYGSEAVSQLLDYAFNKLNMEKVEAKVFVGNHSSRRIFEKNGFQLEGTLRRCVKKNGKLVDEWIFGILKEEFLKN